MSVGDELRDLADRIEGHIAIAPHEIRGARISGSLIACLRIRSRRVTASSRSASTVPNDPRAALHSDPSERA